MVRARPDPPICPPANPVHVFLRFGVPRRRRRSMAARVSGSENKGDRRAVLYLRTSSMAHAGPDGHSPHRQNDACMAHAARAGLQPVACFYDPGVSGTDAVTSRPGFNAMLAFVRETGIGTIL